MGFKRSELNTDDTDTKCECKVDQICSCKGLDVDELRVESENGCDLLDREHSCEGDQCSNDGHVIPSVGLHRIHIDQDGIYDSHDDS